MSEASKDVHKLLKELEGKINEIPIHVYIMIWAVTDMGDRMQRDDRNPQFCDICYPFTKVPLFSTEESSNLENLWRSNIKNNPDLFPEPPSRKQTGGRAKLSFSDMKKKAKEFGQDLDLGLKALDPKLLSPDYLYDYTTNLFDTLDSKITEASGNFGVIALENTSADPMLPVPTMPPFLLPIPGKSIFPVINAVLEALRITNSIVFKIDPFGVGAFHRNILTLLMVCLDLARGNMYHAIFTSFGFMGNNPMFIGIVLKILRDAIMLISPDLRTDLRDILFKSSKSFVTGFSIWLFTTMSPQFVREPVAALFVSVSTALDEVNNKMDLSEKKIDNTPAGKLAHIRLPRIPTDKIPDVNNLYSLREALREPAIYCDPKVDKIINLLRDVPPYALFFDLALIPRKDTKEYSELCAPFQGSEMTDNLLRSFVPEIIIKEPELPEIPGLQSIPSPTNPLLATPKLALEGLSKNLAASAGTGLLEAGLDPKSALQAGLDPKAALEAHAKAVAQKQINNITKKATNAINKTTRNTLKKARGTLV